VHSAVIGTPGRPAPLDRGASSLARPAPAGPNEPFPMPWPGGRSPAFRLPVTVRRRPRAPSVTTVVEWPFRGPSWTAAADFT